jgi:hypothetical protein
VFPMLAPQGLVQLAMALWLMSQFAPSEAGAIPTRLTASSFPQLIESRDAQFGARAGVAFAEGVVVKEPVLRPNLFK